MALRPYDFFSTYPADVTNWSNELSLFPQPRQELARLRHEAVQPLAPLMSADLIESENEYKVHVDLPGAENLDISVDNGMLTISAEKKVKHNIDTDITHTVERSYGKVKRRVSLPSDADADRASAKYRDGVLTISMPKKESPAHSKIRIE
jgi:HSP20 family molecular chaperone IbpA